MNPEAKEAAEAIGQMIGVNLAVIQILEEVYKHGYQQGVRDCSEVGDIQSAYGIEMRKRINK